jgi:hypothetical protein
MAEYVLFYLIQILLLMWNTFTKQILVLLLILNVSDLSGQINTLTVNNPASAAGNYPIVRAAFGAREEIEISADAAFATDANGTELCGEATNVLTGKIAFLDRGGSCTFIPKVLNAQNAGAIAVIVCNNAANSNQEPIVMPSGKNAELVTVPAFMASYTSCQKIRTAILAGEADVTLQFYCQNKGKYPDNTIWGNGPDENGFRGDFYRGLNGWTIDKPGTWHYSAESKVIGGLWLGSPIKINSWTDCDGAMVMNSDSLDSGGKNGSAGTGPCPAVCTASLISPNIILPDGIEGITIEFYQALRQYRSTFKLYTSKDDGVTWSDPIDFNTEFPLNSDNIQQRKSILVPGFAGAHQIRFKFEYAGNYYYWAIDDVILKNEVSSNAQINNNWFAVAPTLRVPASQVVPMYFMADISNHGNADATNVDVNVVINDDKGAEIDRLVKNYGVLAAGTSLENGIFEETFLPASTPKMYNAYYEVTSDKDLDVSNNKAPFLFEVTNNTFGTLFSEAQRKQAYMKDITEIWAVTPTNFQSCGTIYYVPKGDGYSVDKVRFGLKNPANEIDGAGFIQVELYEWKDEDKDLSCSPYERKLVGANSIYLEGDILKNPRLIEIPLWAVDDEGNPNEDQEIALKNDQTYVLIAHTRPLDPSFPRIKFLTYNGFGLDNIYDRSVYNYPANYVLDSVGLNYIGGSLFELSGEDENDEAERSYNIFGNTGSLHSLANMYLEMDIKIYNSTYEIAKTGSANVFPNPAYRDMYIDITLDNTSDVKVELISVDGKVVMTKSFDGVKDSRLKLELSGVASGAYTAMIHTNTGVIAKKVVVQK